MWTDEERRERYNANRRAKRQADKADPARWQERREREGARNRRYYYKNRERILSRNRARARERYADDSSGVRRKAREWKARNKDALRKKTKEWRAQNPDRVRAWNRKTKYGISSAELRALAIAQRELCAICRDPLVEGGPRRAVHVDHCHRTGAIRGLLCSGCNVGLGRFRDDVQRLERAIAYLRRFA